MLIFGDMKSLEKALEARPSYTIYWDHCGCPNCNEFHIDSIVCDACDYDIYGLSKWVFSGCYDTGDIERIITDKYKDTCPKCKIEFFNEDFKQFTLNKYLLT